MNLSNDSFVSGFPSMTITPAGDIYVVWSNSEESGIIHCRHWAGSWQPKQTLITGVGDDQAWGPFFITSDWFENLYLFYAGPSGSSKSRLMVRRFADFDLEDKDGDGYTWDVDCYDSDNTIYPGAREIRDGKDNDCDGEIDEGVHTEVGTDVKVCDDAEDICITFPEVMEEGNTNVFAEDCQDSPEGLNLTPMAT